MSNDDMNFLSEISFFKELNPAEIEKFFSILKRVKFRENETIVTEGEEGYTMYIFREGVVQVVSHITLKVGSHKWSDAEKSIASLDAKQMSVFGEMSLITGAPRSATIKAITPCILYEINKDDFDALAIREPLIGYKIMKELSGVLSNRIKNMNGTILKLTTALSIALSKKKK
ncbi:MAG: cyclic nucleotide-binding domain-containing protein [Brevinematales bacterium]|nr:cyclic nucleotide-binding domain-containing protein [Brevinematales bacterium]